MRFNVDKGALTISFEINFVLSDLCIIGPVVEKTREHYSTDTKVTATAIRNSKY